MKDKFIYVCIALFLPASAAFAQNDSAVASSQTAKTWEKSDKSVNNIKLIEGNAVLVFSGDTIGIVAKDGTRYTVRLRGIDAPEKKQPFSEESAAQLAYLVQGMNVTAVVSQVDANNHYVSSVFLDGEDVSLAQVSKGMAWSYSRHGGTMTQAQRAALAKAEQKARADRAGLWVTFDPVAPWVFRGEAEVRDDIKTAPADTSANNTDGAVSKPVSTDSPNPAAVPTPERKYILGPRGGCYYFNEQGAKVYVRNKELCRKE